MTDSPARATIWHNPDCGTSRNVLAILTAAGAEPLVIDYQQAGWTAALLQDLFATAGVTPREALRLSRSPAEELGLTDPAVNDAALIAAMLEHPVLVNRPFVRTAKGTALCRPSERVLDLLDRLPPGPLYKEDGSLILDAEGRRVG
ncbi:arsenate reductase (glutaredoxin) [Neotabrizicola sp. VNH66]|uniref:arsenate reductase (glutaredoxin) n=1 Tax=Neotabrizicola sp. VNH66 TaxID=3400918 RepID=UPI003C11846F